MKAFVAGILTGVLLIIAGAIVQADDSICKDPGDGAWVIEGREAVFNTIAAGLLMSPQDLKLKPVVVVPSNNQSVAPVQAPGQTWNCSIDYDCGDFNSRAELDSYWSACPGDPSNLDAEGDGRYCESVR
jgi:hypothetical protein